MKNIYLLVIIAFSMNAFSQSQIDFIVKNSQPKIEKDTSKLTLPLSIRFKESDFNGEVIIFKSPGTNTKISGSEKKFGREIKIGPQDSGYFKIELAINKEDGKVQANPFTDFNCPDNSVILELFGKQFLIRYKNKGDQQKVSKKDQNYTAGYIYYDALALVSDNILPLTKLGILENYGFKGSENNPFLKDIYHTTDSLAQGHTSLSAAELLTNLGNTDVTYFAAGLARFLAQRTKEELNEAFFTKMKEQLNAYPELKTVFPKTASFLDIIETYSYASIIQVLKEAFETDIQNLPENLYNVKNLTVDDCKENIICGKDKKDCNPYKHCRERLQKLTDFFNSEEGRWIGLGMFAVKEAVQSTNPADLIKSITISDEFKGIKKFSKDNLKYADYNVASSIELTNFISQSLISKNENQIWINQKELNALFTTKDAFKVYLGLLLAREQSGEVKIDFYKTGVAKDTITFGNILRKVHDSIEKYKPQITSLIKNTYAAFNSANNAVKKMIAANDKSVEADPQALYNYYRAFTASLKPIAQSELLKSITAGKGLKKDFGKQYDIVEQILNPSVDIAYHISTKKYSAAIYDASILLSALDTFNVLVDKKFLWIKCKKEEEVFKTVNKSFVKYGTLISTIASAQSSDEVKQALEASVLPVGSSSIKRSSKWSFSINSYVGAYWSYANNIDYIPTWGLSAPVGFNISRGFSKSGKAGGLSLNFQLIDVGALVNYYLLKGDTASLPNDFSVKLSNIFSPGLNLSYNVPRTPLSLAWGCQYIPTLYKYELVNGKNELNPTNAWRWQLALLIDIPLYNLKVWDFRK